MQITRVELTNIKPFAERAFEFSDGVNVLSGPNGSGKSTVFEAIGYALFGVDAREFIGSSERFVRKGHKTGKVRVYFSGEDGNNYIIERTAGGASRWILLCETADGPGTVETKGAQETAATLTRLLGLSTSRRLDEQFTTIIGPPQAQFEGAFGVTGVRRATEFDRILGISAWTEAASKALSIDTEAKGRIQFHDLRSKSLADQTARYDSVVAELASTTAIRDSLTSQLASSKTALSETASLVALLTTSEIRAVAMRTAVEVATTTYTLASERAGVAKRDLAASLEAVAICASARDSFVAHTEATASLAALELERKDRDALTRRGHALATEIAKTEAESSAALSHADIELGRIERDTAAEQVLLEAAEIELAQIAVDLERTAELDSAASLWLGAFKGLASPVNPVAAARRAVELAGVARESVTALRAEVSGRDEVVARAALHAAAKVRATVAVEAVAGLEAHLDRFRRDADSLAAGHCPILDESCLNLSDTTADSLAPDARRAPFAKRIADAEASREEALSTKQAAELDVARSAAAVQQLAVLDAASHRLAMAEAELARRDEDARLAIETLTTGLDSSVRAWLRDAPPAIDINGVEASLSHLESLSQAPLPSMSFLASGAADDGDNREALDAALTALAQFERGRTDAWRALDDAAGVSRSTVGLDRLRLDERKLSALSVVASTNERIRLLGIRAEEHCKARTAAELQLAELETKRRDADAIAGALVAFADLDQRVDTMQARVTASREAFNLYRQHESEARRHDAHEAAHRAIAASHAEAQAALGEAHAKAAKADAELDPAALAAARERERTLSADCAAQSVRIKAASADIDRLAADLIDLERLREEKSAIDRELVLLRKTHEAIVAMRNVVMKSVPQRLGTRYREDVSVRADQIHRRIAGSDEELRWGDGYQIELHDMSTDAKGRSFERVRYDEQLSGGQKMTAVIALRLALLQMTRSSIGFFDEPTTNLDAERRARLAEVFRDLGEGRDGGGRWAGQIFLISHDVAFTGITDHTTWLEAETP